MKTLLVVDDHPIVLEGIHSVLARRGFKVLKATSASQAISIAGRTENIDIFVIDLSLSEGTDGLILIEKLRALGYNTPMVVYTMHEELWNISALMKADVEGIVLKGDNINELVHAIRVVADGGTYRSSAFDEKRREVMQTNGILSTKDVEVLRLLADGAGNREIAEAMGISEKTVEYHRSNILKKLCSRTMFEATRRAIALGIICTFLLLLTAGSVSAATAAVDERPRAVDLGLSVLWADRNLGAASPLEPGGFYAFGETAEKDTYTWDSYVHCDSSMFYCHDLGTENISGTEYDAARVVLGEGWRMPTTEEFSELLNACTATTDTIDGDIFTVVTSPGGAVLRVPWAGYMNGKKLVYKNKNGVYYTSILQFETEDLSEFGVIGIASTIAPNYIAFHSGGINLFDTGAPNLGQSIRPVRDRTTSAVEETLISTEKAATIRQIFSLDGRPLGPSTENLAPGIYIIHYSDGSTAKTIRQ